jgi:ParB family chromosome partitioning protein
VSAKKRGLGRGLDALLGSDTKAADSKPGGGDELRQLPIDLIERGKYQPRVDMKTDSLQGLADSIKARGVIQPVVVRALPGTRRFELIAGERRWRATQLAGLQEIPALVREVSDEAALSVALIENIQREDLNPIEEAAALQRLSTEFDLTHQQVADAVGRSRTAVSNLLRLLELDENVKTMVESRELEMGHARALLTLAADKQRSIAQQVVKEGLSVRQTERLVKSLASSKDNSKLPRAKDPDITKLENDLAERLGAKVAVRHSASGGGSVTVSYHSLDELDGILSHIK